MFDVDAALMTVIELEASDLHLKVPAPPIIRQHGKLVPIEGSAQLRPEDTENTLFHMLTDEAKLESFRNEREVDFSYSVPGVARFRVNAFVQRGSITIVMRALPYDIPTAEDLGLPDVVTDIAYEERGIILVTGTTGSGKSTTLASMIEQINQREEKHIVTIEDPIEYLHRDAKCEVNQREVGSDTESFRRALRRVLRQDPDVILIGEMRDEETVRTALSAAETGHLVLSTLHTLDAAESVNRIIDFFPPHQQLQARAMLSSTLRAIISQRLVPGIEGGRVLISEVMRVTARIKDMIVDPEQTPIIEQAISEGAYYGMQTFDQDLYDAFNDGRITMETALRFATKPHDFKLLVDAEGHLGTTMHDHVFR
jgi:twitching motility protein PilT